MSLWGFALAGGKKTNVILAKKMGLSKAVQSVSMLGFLQVCI